ncbi:MAG: acetyl-CoA decarbonylase/synthase complex subunit delta [Thermodesulfobacteriota bacterium]|nr:acetyl-CoA decarbonylase/synthase complex subunit delta [Thermodesulfobacteriota bacterium]
MISGSNLEQILTSGQFAVTGELGPPKNGDFDVVRDKARILKGHVDAVNITDCQTAIVRMSSLTAGLIALAEGVEPVMQMTCRDRNRIGIQSDILGASALGIKNLLCLTGDHQKFGNHPQAKGVFDMDSIQLLGMVKAMREDKKFQCGDEIKAHEPRLFLGAAANPFADPFEYRPIRVAKKVEAGASFIQTQIIYNVEKFARFMEIVRDLGLHEKVYILAGVTPPKSVGMARYMKKFVPGLDVTDEVIERLKGAKDPKEEGINICVDIIKQVREIPGVAGVHVMAIEWEQAVPEIVSLAGLSPRPGAKAVEPRLRSSESIELIVSEAKEGAKAETEKALEQAKAEAQASRDLVVKERERVTSEISGLKRQAEKAKAIASQKNTEIERLTAELAKTKAGQGHVQAVRGLAEDRESRALSSRERSVLTSLRSGLEALSKGLGINEDQLEALRRLFEAEFLLHADTAEQITAPSEEPVPPRKEIEKPEAEARHKEVVNLVAKGNVLLHKNDAAGALDAFEKALAIEPKDQKAGEGLKKARDVLEIAAPAEKAAAPASVPEGVPPCPEGLSPEEWQQKWVIRLVATGNMLLHKSDATGALKAFKQALELKPGDEKAKAGLLKAESGEVAPVPVPAEPDVTEKEVTPLTPEPKAAPVTEELKAEAKKEAPVPTAPTGIEDLSVAELPKETRSLSERAGSIPVSLFTESCTGAIREVSLGEGEKALTVGGVSILPFHLFEGDMPHVPRIAYDVLDSEPEDWPDVLGKYYSDVFSDPVAWARKCIDDYGAEAICLSLVSTDPNGMNRPSDEAAKVAQSVIEGIDVPVILWGCGNAEKDTETLREVTNLVGNRKVCLGPLSDANYRSLGATAMAFQLPVVASTPIDVNLAKQLNILLENLGLSLNQILMDPSIGAVGYGIEYSYSVMERIRLAALTQQDEKLQVPFICNLGREVWKTKECRLPSDALLGDQERRGVLMEAVTASTLLLAGGELMVMMHPKAVALTEELIKGMM